MRPHHSSKPFSCVVCSHDKVGETITRIVKGDDSGALSVVTCEGCGHVQMHPPDYDLGFYEKDGQVNNVFRHYGTPMEKLLDHSWTEARRRFERFAHRGISILPVDADRPLRILDVGGGYGFFGSELKSRMPSCEVTVLEPSASRSGAGKQWLEEGGHALPRFINGLLDEAFVRTHRGQYDLVTMWHVLEHVTDPVALMRDCTALLAPGGLLCIEVPNLDDELAPLSPAFRARTFMVEHISYFSPHLLKVVAGRAAPGAKVSVLGYQRYGIFNYIHWIRNNAPQGADPDLFNGTDRMWIEATWRHAREATLTSDALFMTVRV